MFTQLFLNIVLFAVTVTLIAARASGIKTLLLQAAAHLFVGGLIVAAWFMRKETKYYLYLAIILTVAEVICFFLVK